MLLACHSHLRIMAPERMAAVLQSPNQLCYCVCFFPLFLTYFVHNVSATVSYDRNKLLEIRTAITHLTLKDHFFFNELGERDLFQTPDKALIPVIPDTRQGPHPCHSHEKETEISRTKVEVPCKDPAASG